MKKSKTSEKLISNTVYLFLAWTSSILFSFLFWLIIGKTSSPSEYGIIATSINFVVLLSNFLLLGINTAHSKLIPEVFNKNGMEGVHSLVKLSMKPLIILFILLTPVLLLFSNQFSVLLKIPHNIMVLNIIFIFVYVFFLYLGSIMYSLQKMKKYALTDLFQYVFRIIFGVVLFFLGFGYFGILFGFYLSYFLFLFFRLDINYFRGGKSSVSYKKLFSYAIPALVMSAGWAIIVNSQYIILTILKDIEITGLFAVALTPISMIAILMTVLNSALVPIISSLSTNRKTKDRQIHLISIVLRYSLFIVFPIAILLLVFSKYVILLLSKPEFLSAASYFPILIPAVVLLGFGTIFQTNVYIIGHPKKSRNMAIETTLLFLLISIPSTYYFSAMGLSFAYLISMIFFIIISFLTLRKFLKVEFPWEDFKKIVISSLVVFALLYLLKPFIHSFFWLIPIGVAGSIIYLLVLLSLRFYRNEDVKILEYLIRNIPFGKNLKFLIDFLKTKIEK